MKRIVSNHHHPVKGIQLTFLKFRMISNYRDITQVTYYVHKDMRFAITHI